MTRILTAVALVALVLVGPPAVADEDRAAQVEQRMEEARTRLNLSDEQVDQVAPLLEESMRAQQNIMESYGIDPGNQAGMEKIGLRQARAMSRELNAVRSSTVDALGGVLTDQQLDEFKAMQEERKAEMRERMRAGR